MAGGALAGEPGQRRERRTGRAETPQHRVERHRPDRLGTGEPQPVEALLRIEFASLQGGFSLFRAKSGFRCRR
jgi:hypothetical protein